MNETRHIELNVRSCGGFGETVITPEEIVAFTAKNGSPAVAITDTDSVYSVPALKQATKKIPGNVKAIYGVRVRCAAEDGSEFPVTLLARTRLGLTNIFRILSLAYIQTLHGEKPPCAEWHDVLRNKKDVLIGRACLWDYIDSLRGASEEVLAKELNTAFDGADYVEISPFYQSRFACGVIDSEKEAVKETAYAIVKTLQKIGKTPVAVSNAVCITKEDELCLDMLRDGGGRAAYMKSTEETLLDFSFLKDMAEQVVIENTNRIAGKTEAFDPLACPSCRFELPNAENEVRNRCRKTAEEKYGPLLPAMIKERMADELTKIADANAWSYYLLAAKLSDACRETGYLHNVRGGAGCSFVSYLLGITETDPLPPHFYCPKCKKIEFVEKTKAAPDGAVCCASKMVRDGHDLSAETFQGLFSEKVPDFQFNFAGEIVKDMVKKLEEICGQDKVFCTGVADTVPREDAARLLARYCRRTGFSVDETEKERILRRMTSVCEKTGKNAGRFFIVPQGRDIFDFAPIGYADPVDYRLDRKPATLIEGQALPPANISMLGFTLFSELKRMEEFSGVSAKDIRLDEVDITSFFDADGGDSLNGFSFHNAFFKKIIRAVKPTAFSDLVKISGLAHGTGVWENNAENLLKAGHPTDGLIAFPDDVMRLLTQYGVDRCDAFSIAEYVRKGNAYRGFRDEHLQTMRDHNVPDRLIASMRKIRYLFPKAHAVEYVTNYLRKIWYKLHYPLAFYAAVLTVDFAADFDYGLLCEGKARVEAEYKCFLEEWGRDHVFSEAIDEGWAEADKRIMELALECFDRGITVLPADVNLSDDGRFMPENDSIRLPYNRPNWLSPATVAKINAERAQKPFASKEDFIRRVPLKDRTLITADNERIHTTEKMADNPELDRLFKG